MTSFFKSVYIWGHAHTMVWMEQNCRIETITDRRAAPSLAGGILAVGAVWRADLSVSAQTAELPLF